MYAIVHKNFVICTQPNWNTRVFTNILFDECNIEKRVSFSDEGLVPWTLDENTKILKIIDQRPEFNPKIEWLDGPNYVVIESFVATNYFVKPLDLSIAKGNLINQLPALRYEREKKSVDITLQDLKITLPTDRETRAVFTNKLLAIGENSINFKFQEGWLNLSKADLEFIVQQIDVTVQETFDWELSKMNEINACKNLEEIKKIELVKQPKIFVPEPNPQNNPLPLPPAPPIDVFPVPTGTPEPTEAPLPTIEPVDENNNTVPEPTPEPTIAPDPTPEPTLPEETPVQTPEPTIAPDPTPEPTLPEETPVQTPEPTMPNVEPTPTAGD
jgi:hypothetical protein